MSKLKVNNLSFQKGYNLLFENLSFEINSGEALKVSGPNGSGKTTLLRYIAGLSTNNLLNDNIAYSGHLDGVKSTLTVQENLKFWSGIYNTNDMANVIKTLKLNDFQNRIAGELSAGQKRRLGLARMLITNAKIWLMDEPTVSLDKTTTTLISEIITQHCKEGGAAIISTHVNLNLPSSKVLDISEFKPEIDKEFDPFLEGVF